MAFALVDEDNSGTISFHEFVKLSQAVHPESSATQRSLLYKLLDSDGSESVSASEFVRLSDVLLLAVRENRQELTRRWPFLKWRVAWARRITDHPLFERVVLALILVYVGLLAVQAHPNLTELVPASAEAGIDAAFIGAFALEACLKVAALSAVGYFGDNWNRIDFAVIVLSAAMLVMRAAVADAAGGTAIFASARVLRVLRVLRTIRTVSIFSHSHKLRTLSRLFVQMRPVIVTILGTILMVFYAYLVVGCEAFAGKTLYSSEARSACGNFCPSFDSPLIGAITLLQLVLASNWAELIYLLRGDGGLFLTWLYLISFVLVTNAIMLPLLSALILEIYSMETDKMVARTSSENQLATLFPQDALTRNAGGVGRDKYVVVLSNGVRALFEKYDKDRSGSISALELGHLLADLGERLKTEELKAILDTLDVDSNGQIAFGEFLTWWQRFGLEKCFNRFDTDNSGTIDAAELGELMTEVGSPMYDDELDDALRELDKDGSGAIGFDEYASWFGDYDVRKVFAAFDEDSSGLISHAELEQILAHMGFELSQEELKIALQRLDQDFDGGVNFEEFLPWWKVRQRAAPRSAAGC
jgi:Ca2+-binding EF-hand superfamily protein